MKALQQFVLTLTVVVLAALAPVAHAQTQSYNFVDKDGAGVMTVKAISRIPCSDLTSCQVWLEQNGYIIYGTGCVTDTGTISCTFTHKQKQCGCTTSPWEPIDSTILVCRFGGGGGWHRVGQPQNSYCCELRYR